VDDIFLENDFLFFLFFKMNATQERKKIKYKTTFYVQHAKCKT